MHQHFALISDVNKPIYDQHVDNTIGMRVLCECHVALQSSIPSHKERHAHTPNIMLPHHHIDFFLHF